MNDRPRSGLTVVELLVVIAVIGLVLAVLLPAVQTARESGRRAECAARLGQFARALQAYESANKAFPAANMPLVSPRLRGAGWFSPHAHLLPYLEQTPLAQAIDINCQTVIMSNWTVAPPSQDSYETPLPVFACPSDVNAGGFVPRNNFRVCTGSSPYVMHDEHIWPKGGNGAFTILKQLAPADFLDGLSNTLGVAEKAVGSGDAAGYHRRVDYWSSGVSELGPPFPNSDAMAAICSSILSAPALFRTDAGAQWAYSGYDYTWYSHVSTPNSQICDCSFNMGNAVVRIHMQGGVFRASSYHPGGVNGALMDGSVRFTADNIALHVWRSLATRAGDGA